jgi:Arc/MetJ-type ribon-helix-helix transcriptional regulator
MHRIQIQLTEEQERMLKDIARLRNASISALVREGVELLLEPERTQRTDRVRRGMAYVGFLGPDPEGATDVSRKHDAYLADAYAGKFPGDTKK